MEAQLNRKMIQAAQKTIVLADSTKFGKRGVGGKPLAIHL